MRALCPSGRGIVQERRVLPPPQAARHVCGHAPARALERRPAHTRAGPRAQPRAGACRAPRARGGGAAAGAGAAAATAAAAAGAATGAHAGAATAAAAVAGGAGAGNDTGSAAAAAAAGGAPASAATAVTAASAAAAGGRARRRCAGRPRTGRARPRRGRRAGRCRHAACCTARGGCGRGAAPLAASGGADTAGRGPGKVSARQRACTHAGSWAAAWQRTSPHPAPSTTLRTRMLLAPDELCVRTIGTRSQGPCMC